MFFIRYHDFLLLRLLLKILSLMFMKFHLIPGTFKHFSFNFPPSWSLKPQMFIFVAAVSVVVDQTELWWHLNIKTLYSGNVSEEGELMQWGGGGPDVVSPTVKTPSIVSCANSVRVIKPLHHQQSRADPFFCVFG